MDDKDAVEQSLLKELEEMGFRQVDLNKEILRMNDYNLEQSVDVLCGVADAEWDPILEELQEMVSYMVQSPNYVVDVYDYVESPSIIIIFPESFL